MIKAIKNVLIQLLWVCLALIIGIYIASSIFESLLLRSIFGGVFSLIVYLFFCFIANYIKAFKDPDVRAASSLGMSVNRYRRYRQYYDEWQDVMNKYGTDSKESDSKFEEIFSKIESPNDWRKYQEYRFRQSAESMGNALKEMMEREIVSEPWHSRFTTGSRLLVKMEDGNFVNGYITDIDTQRCLYIVKFDEPVSLMTSEEPYEGWSDNAYPSNVLELTDKDMDLILDRKLIGTNVHYHF